jgi:hypothetical protein
MKQYLGHGFVIQIVEIQDTSGGVQIGDRGECEDAETHTYSAGKTPVER